MAKRQLKNGLIASMLSFCATVIVPPPLVGGHTRASCPQECASVLTVLESASGARRLTASMQVYLSTSKYAASVFACIEMGRGAEPPVHLLAAYPAIECGTASAHAHHP